MSSINTYSFTNRGRFFEGSDFPNITNLNGYRMTSLTTTGGVVGVTEKSLFTNTFLSDAGVNRTFANNHLGAYTTCVFPATTSLSRTASLFSGGTDTTRSMAAWVRIPTGWGTAGEITNIFGMTDSFAIFINSNGRLSINLDDSAGASVTRASLDIRQIGSNWAHFAMALDDNNLQVFMNGIEIFSLDGPFTFDLTGEVVFVHGTGATDIPIEVDDIWFQFGTKWSESEVQNMYEVARYTNTVTHYLPASTIGGTNGTQKNYNWTCPDGVTQVTATLVSAGAGGGSGGATINGAASGGGGGGAGDVDESVIVSGFVPGSNYILSVGGGGAGAAGVSTTGTPVNGNAGTFGTTTSIFGSGINFAAAPGSGGGGGQGVSSGANVQTTGGAGGLGARNGGQGGSQNNTVFTAAQAGFSSNLAAGGAAGTRVSADGSATGAGGGGASFSAGGAGGNALTGGNPFKRIGGSGGGGAGFYPGNSGQVGSTTTTTSGTGGNGGDGIMILTYALPYDLPNTYPTVR